MKIEWEPLPTDGCCIGTHTITPDRNGPPSDWTKETLPFQHEYG